MVMKTKEKPFRHELKYVIGEPEKALLTERFKPLIQLDKHATNGGYTIRSLYFDDYWNSAYAEKDAGILVRKKYRIRIYNFGTNSIKLERKKKVDTYILKEDAPLTVEEFYKIIDGDYDFLLKSPYPLCQDFYYECVSNMMRPRTIVDYEREPWVYDFGTVRLTFDQNVRVAVGSFDIFDPDLPTIPVIDPEKMVFEVKYTEYLPKIVQSVLPGKADMMAVSKYVLAYEKSQYLNGFEYWEDGNI